MQALSDNCLVLVKGGFVILNFLVSPNEVNLIVEITRIYINPE
jgi:hypothetical protein